MATTNNTAAIDVSIFGVEEVGAKTALEYCYWEKGLSTRDLAEILDVTAQTVSRWMEQHGVERRTAAEASRQANRVERASFVVNEDGYEQWTVNDPAGCTTVGVHQLRAIADGADPHTVFDSGTHVHHRSGVPWDNRESVLVVVTAAQHHRTHSENAWTYDSGLGCRVLETAERDDGGDADE